MWEGIFKLALLQGAVLAGLYGVIYSISFFLRFTMKSRFSRKPSKIHDYYEIKFNEIILSLFIIVYIIMLPIIFYGNLEFNGKLISSSIGFIALYCIYYSLNYRILWNTNDIKVITIFGVRKIIAWDAVTMSNLQDADGFYVQHGRTKISVTNYNLGHKYLWRYARCRLKNVPHVRSL